MSQASSFNLDPLRCALHCCPAIPAVYVIVVLLLPQLRAGVACVTVSGAGWAASTVCVEGFPLVDGVWHTVAAELYGHSLVVTVDDGDGWRRNQSLVTLESMDGAPGPPPYLDVGASQSAVVGVWQETAVDTAQNDLQDDLHKREFPHY